MDTRVVFRKLVSGYRNLNKKESYNTYNPIPVIISGSPSKLQIGSNLIQQPVMETSLQTVEQDQKTEYIFDGVEIPEFSSKKITFRGIKEEEQEGKASFIYPLIPEKPTKNEPVLAYAKISWNQEKNRYEYSVVQPQITQELQGILVRIKSLLEEKLDVDFAKMKETEVKDYLHNQIEVLMNYFGIKISEVDKQVLFYYIDRDFLGLGMIEPLMHDSEIEDISCDGAGIPVFVFHRNPKIGSIVTNLMIEDKDELDTYLIRLAQLTGQAVSVIDPLLNGTLPDGSRIQGTLGTDIAKRGSNFTIRKFTKFPFTPTHFLNYGTLDIKTLAFLWMTVDYSFSLLASGGTATGKTSFLNMLSLFIRPEMKIVSIEDTGEIQLPHPHWIPHVSRVAISDQNKQRGDVDLFDLLRESLRQRPDYIIVGEVRGREAYVLFQQMATGHASLATIHAENFDKLIDRLITPPIQLPPSLIESLDVLVFMSNLKYRGKFVRKIQSIYEVIGFDYQKNRPKINKVVEWNSETDKFVIKNKSLLLHKIMKKTGLKDDQIKEELKRRMIVLYWMKERNITDYRDVGRIVNLYYNYPLQVLEAISGEI